MVVPLKATAPDGPSPAASTSASRVNSGAATPLGDVGEEEIDLIESDDENATIATGGVVAGPGPSSLAHSQLAKGLKRAASGSPAPPPKKRRPRTSVATPGLGNYVPPPLPHYTVVRSDPNTKKTPHVIKIHDNVTDGHESRWPAEEERQEGFKVNNKLSWYECQDRKIGRHQSLREKLGEELAKSMGLTNEGAKQEYWVIDNLPKGYLFTVHHCVTSSGDSRTDVYIFGSTVTKKFRTVNELAPHLHWLLLHGPDDDLRCACKYCSKTKQGDVNRVLGLNIRSSSVASTPAGISSPSVKRKTAASKASSASTGVQAKVAAFRSPGGEKLLGDMTFRKKLKDGTTVEKKKRRSVSAEAGEGSPPPTYKGAYTSRSRDSDLAYPTAPRQADLVYAELPKPFLSDDPEWAGAQITHWPAVVMSRVPYTVAKVANPEPKMSGKREEEEKEEEDPEEGEVKADDESLDPASKVESLGLAPKLEAKQGWRYNVRLLAVKDELRLLREDQLRPWLGNPPPSGLWTPERMCNPDAVKHVWDGKKTHRDCELMKDVKSLQEAVTAMALALQIAAHLVGAFSFNDRYEITDAHFDLATSEPLDPGLVAVQAQQRKSWAFQSLHWGAELIWTGDFIRLIYPFGGHEDSTPIKPTDPDHRALFMKVLAIYKTNDTVNDVERGTGMIGGEIWELRDFAAARGAANGHASEAGPSGQNGMAGGSTNGSAGPSTAANGVGGISPTALNGKEKSASPSPTADDKLPPAPTGMYWHRLTAPSTGVHVTLDYLAGRYHPLPKSLNTQQKIKEALATLDAMDEAAQTSAMQNGSEPAQTVDVALPFEQRMMLLAGLRPAQRLYMKCGAYKGTRHTAVVEAERNASNEVEQYFASMAHQNGGNADASMEDDSA
ncbi:hypothetical protein JCM10296v2_003819 [Rhodotorula toruloides]